jgi:DNA-binding MarR family transcriptional regulator
MRKLELEVPTEIIGAFTEKLTEMGLKNSIIGKTDEDEIVIEVFYQRDQSALVDELEEFLEELKADLYEDYEDEENDEDEEDKR